MTNLRAPCKATFRFVFESMKSTSHLVDFIDSV